MAVTTKTVRTTIVNAAFLQEVKDSNPELWKLLVVLRDLRSWEQDARQTARILVDTLSQLRDCIGLQFSLEETYGFIENGRASMNFGAGSAETAKMQHRELYLELQELCEQAEEAQYRGTIARDIAIYLDAFERFDDGFRAHEELEGELIRCGLGIRRNEF